MYGWEGGKFSAIIAIVPLFQNMLYTNLLFFDKEINLNPGIANISE